jgi:hypothetical protein
MYALPPAFGDLILRSIDTQRKKVPLPHPLATCAHIQHKNVEKQHKNTQHRRRAKKTRKIRQNTGPPAHTKQIQTRRPNRSANHPPAPPYTTQDKTRPHGPIATPQQERKHKNEKQKGAAKTGTNQMQTGQRRRNNSIFDNIKNKSKNRHKHQRFEKVLTSTKKHTTRHTIFRRLICQLEMLLQNHIGPELKSHQTESQIFVQTPSFQTYTKTKLIDQQTRHRFRLIQENVNRYIDLQIKRLNDQSTPLVCNQNIQQRCNGSRTGGSEEQYAEIVQPPPLHPRPPPALPNITNQKASSAKSI